MEQSRTDSFLEAAANQVVGITYAVGIYALLDISYSDGLALALTFSALGLTRVYTIRRIVEWIRRKRKQ